MTMGEHVFQYCERGTNAALWAEPLNAISNAGFLLAALIFWQLLLWRPREERSADHYLLMTLVFLIGIGSLAFHLFANRVTELADVIPIVLFMLVYFGFALNRFLNVPPGWTALLVIGFAGLIGVATQIKCGEDVVGFALPDAKSCLNGSVGYLPALGALIVVGMLAAERRHRAAPYVLAAAVVFIASIILRSLDFALCDLVVIDGRDVGTHFIWHLLNAVVLFLLLRASLETKTRAEALAATGPVGEEVSADEGARATDEDDERQSKEEEPEKDALQEAKSEDEAGTKPLDKAKAKDVTEESAPHEEDKLEKTKEPEPHEEAEAEEPDDKDTEAEEPKAEETKTAIETPDQKDASEKEDTKDDETSEDVPEKDASSEPAPEGTEPDKTPTPEDVFKAVKALSSEDGPEKPSPRKRGTRRKKPSTD